MKTNDKSSSMKSIFSALPHILFWMFFGLFLGAFPAIAWAQSGGPIQQPGAIPALDITTALNLLALLATSWVAQPGFSAVIAGLINIGKSFGLVKDGDAPKWYGGINLILFATVAALLLFIPATKLDVLNNQFGMLAGVLAFIGLYVKQLVSGPEAHEALKALEIPGISTSYSSPASASG